MIIQRATRWSAFGQKLVILIDQDQKAILANHDSITLPKSQKEEQTLSIKHSFHSTITASAKDQLTIVDNPYHLLPFLTGIILIVIAHLTLSFDSALLVWLSIVGLVLIVSSFFIPKTRWQKQTSA
ncbi:hypothetical protein [Streptococcus halichoeri]|uniref:hypothetical protein n=1 Tax=Streptococcus halichoeri TaxID=254785 RepID=UPI00135B1C03|nr:hypothetical protein [Streptococcus halichoeri]